MSHNLKDLYKLYEQAVRSSRPGFEIDVNESHFGHIAREILHTIQQVPVAR